MEETQKTVLTADGLQSLLDVLIRRGYRTVGPVIRDKAIVYDDMRSVSELPKGWTDEQEPGHYRLIERGGDALFDYTVGPHSWKRFLHPPLLPLWSAKREGGAVEVTAEPASRENFAFIGVRACELHAIAIQDKVLLDGPYVDPHYRARREGSFIVAVNCSKAGGTCFCASMNSGPKAKAGFDMALTEIVQGDAHLFVAEMATETGRQIMEQITSRPASADEIAAAETVIAHTAASMGREMPASEVRDLLMRNLEHPRWDDVAARCLSCANCTMVCPTCFCTSVEDASDLTGNETSRNRRWDSCFTMEFSYVNGGAVRPSTRARYRQWMTHKLASWHDQFGSSGCVGCGRCISWCPVGIDITKEVHAIRESENSGKG